LNQVYERDTDSLMWRTRSRPLAAQRVSAFEATIFSSVLAAAGLAIVAASSNLVAAFLTLLTLVSYNLIYTPMKRRSQLATLVGAVPGALPPMIGWVAARGAITAEAWALFGLSSSGRSLISWRCKKFIARTFRRAGFPMLPVVEPMQHRAAGASFLFSPCLSAWRRIYASAEPATRWRLSGGSRCSRSRRVCTGQKRRSRTPMFLGSITYLPLLWIALASIAHDRRRVAADGQRHANALPVFSCSSGKFSSAAVRSTRIATQCSAHSGRPHCS
jgi:protoheme IX farnesyltransferase